MKWTTVIFTLVKVKWGAFVGFQGGKAKDAIHLSATSAWLLGRDVSLVERGGRSGATVGMHVTSNGTPEELRSFPWQWPVGDGGNGDCRGVVWRPEECAERQETGTTLHVYFRVIPRSVVVLRVVLRRTLLWKVPGWGERGGREGLPVAI